MRALTAAAVAVVTVVAGAVAGEVVLASRGVAPSSAAVVGPVTPPLTASPDTTIVEASPTTTTTSTTTTTVPAQAVRRGEEGPAVAEVQALLAAHGFDPGEPDGRFGSRTQYAVWAFQKLHGAAPSGELAADLVTRLRAGDVPAAPLLPGAEPDRVEVDLVRQLLLVWHRGELRLVTHVSTGNGQRYCEAGVCGVAVTPVGAHRFYRRVDGWRTSYLGRLYNPVYFKRGWAVHGSPSVPPYPASHGCVRIPMHIAEYFPGLVPPDSPVYVLDGHTPVTPLPAA